MQVSENHIAESDIQIRFFIRLISENPRSISLFFNKEIRHY